MLQKKKIKFPEVIKLYKVLNDIFKKVDGGLKMEHRIKTMLSSPIVKELL